MEKERTESLTLKKDDGTVLYIWLEKIFDDIYLKSSTRKDAASGYTDVVLYQSGQADTFPTGSFKTWTTI